MRPDGAAGRLRLALWLTAGILVVEVVGGITARSLALLSDAGHVVADMAALGLSIFALAQAGRPATPRRTFGYHRVGILVALANALLLGGIVVAIVIEAVRRLRQPEPIHGVIMVLAALIALAVSGTLAFALRPLGRDLTIRSVLVHIWGDAWAALGVILGGLVILWTGWRAIDPLLSLAIAALIAWSAWQVLAAGVEILLEATPADLNPAAIVEAVRTVPGVRDLHDLHLWSLGSQVRAMSAHVLVDDQRVSQAQDILAELREILAHQFRIEHTTIQFEGEVCRAGDVFCVEPGSHPHLEDVHDRTRRRQAG